MTKHHNIIIKTTKNLNKNTPLHNMTQLKKSKRKLKKKKKNSLISNGGDGEDTRPS